MPDFEQELQVAVHAAQLSSAISLGVQRDQSGADSPMDKGEKDPVTVADYAAQAIILHTLSEQFADDSVLSEESAADFDRLASEVHKQEVRTRLEAALGRTVMLDDVRRWLDYGKGKSGSRMWTIDPVDGTKGFIRNDQYAIAVALLIDQQPVLGVLACPRLPFKANENEGGCIATARRGQGAAIIRIDRSEERALKVSQEALETHVRIAGSVELRHNDQRYTDALMAQAGLSAEIVRIDSQVKYVVLADNRADVYIRQSSTSGYIEKIWDHVAGALIVEEAGGIVSDLSGAALDYTAGSGLSRNKGVLAAAASVHQRIIDAARIVEANS